MKITGAMLALAVPLAVAAQTTGGLPALKEEVVQVQSNLNAETAARQEADTLLKANIDAETAARASGDASLQSRLDGEAARAKAAEHLLQTSLESISLTPGPVGPTGPTGPQGPKGDGGPSWPADPSRNINQMYGMACGNALPFDDGVYGERGVVVTYAGDGTITMKCLPCAEIPPVPVFDDDWWHYVDHAHETAQGLTWFLDAYPYNTAFYGLDLLKRGAFADGLTTGTFAVPASEGEIVSRYWDDEVGPGTGTYELVKGQLTLTSVSGRLVGTVSGAWRLTTLTRGPVQRYKACFAGSYSFDVAIME